VHELGLCASVVDAVERRAAGRPVARVRVRVGALLHVHPEAFGQSFEVAAAGGVAEGAEAELVVVPGRAACGACGGFFDVYSPPAACPACGEVAFEVDGGEELTLESIEYRPNAPGAPEAQRAPAAASVARPSAPSETKGVADVPGHTR
jgi:hydrogenase nickel incorporation protein HypA/HybF